jgi:hypothetical protein
LPLHARLSVGMEIEEAKWPKGPLIWRTYLGIRDEKMTNTNDWRAEWRERGARCGALSPQGGVT